MQDKKKKNDFLILCQEEYFLLTYFKTVTLKSFGFLLSCRLRRVFRILPRQEENSTPKWYILPTLAGQNNKEAKKKANQGY